MKSPQPTNLSSIVDSHPIEDSRGDRAGTLSLYPQMNHGSSSFLQVLPHRSLIQLMVALDDILFAVNGSAAIINTLSNINMDDFSMVVLRELAVLSCSVGITELVVQVHTQLRNLTSTPTRKSSRMWETMSLLPFENLDPPPMDQKWVCYLSLVPGNPDDGPSGCGCFQSPRVGFRTQMQCAEV